MDTAPTSRPVAFLVTDVEDSTRLWQAAPDAMQASMARHDAILRSTIEAHGGEVFKTAGDAFYATFVLPSRACDAALAVREALLAEAWPAETPIRVRMALHAGSAHARGGDYFGPALNVVSRILSVTRGGQTLMSDAMRGAFADVRRSGVEIESHGFYRLKGIDDPVEVFEQGLRGRSVIAPPQDTDHVYRVVRAGEIWQPVRAIRNNLPSERDSFVGRDTEMRALEQRFDAGARVVTLLGPAGTGKTRLACRYARASLGDWPGGVYFCDLSAARSLDAVVFTVATALDVTLGNDDPVAKLGHAIAACGRCLVILDNFEQITEHAATTLGRWLERTEDASFAVTSRERLRIAGEDVFRIEPLPLAGDAVDLFAARARAQRPDFAVSDENRAAVAEVVQLVDGLPLAIELAAARVRVLSPAQLIERMRDRFRLLAGARGIAERQATLKAAIDWSWDLLAPWEQDAFAQCSVFASGFTMEAAEAVLDLSRWTDAPAVVDAVQALVDKSLLRTWVPEERQRYDVDEPYFGMYLSLQEYAADKLEVGGPDAAPAAQRRHGAYFARFGSDEALEARYRHGGVDRRRALALELDNLIAACRGAVARGEALVAVPTFRAAWDVLELRGPFDVGLALGAQVLGLEAADSSLRTLTIWTQGRILWRMGRKAECEDLLRRALAMARDAGDRHREACLVGALGVSIQDQGRLDEGRALTEAAIALHRELGNRRLEGMELGNLSSLRIEEGRPDEALKLGEAALAIHREVGNRVHEALVLGNLAIACQDQGQIEQALQHYESAIAVQREIGSRSGEGYTLGNLANLLLAQGRLDEAQSSYEAALALARETGDHGHEGIHLGNLANVHIAQRRYDEARALCDHALTIHRKMGNRRFEGMVLGGIATILVEQGNVDEVCLSSRKESRCSATSGTGCRSHCCCAFAGGARLPAGAARGRAHRLPKPKRFKPR